ncbi:MAG: hypothetical protein IKP69_02240 [Oscillospiraceae bacterium]|nr:hypothetical protein [Oscillospiraceae bacterium]
MKHHPLNLYDDEDFLLCNDLDIYYENGEFLPYFNTIYWDKSFNMCLAICPDVRNLQKQEYFLLYSDINPQNAKKSARIKFRNPEYVICSNYSKERWILNTAQRKQLMQMLTHAYAPNYTVWNVLINEFNRELWDDETEKMTLPPDLPIPDYVHYLSI